MTRPGESSEAERYAEARKLATCGAEGVLEAVRPFLADSSWRVRRAAWESLLRSEVAPGDVRGFFIACLDDDDTGVRTAASEALLSLGSEAVPDMLEAAENQSLRVRKAILELLAGIGDGRAQPLALGLLGTDEDENIRFAAAEVLGTVGDADAAREMLRILPTTETSDSFAILAALGRIARRTPFSAALPTLLPYLEDPLCSVPAVRLIGQVGDEEAGPILWKILEGGESDVAIEAFVQFLHRFPDFQPDTTEKVVTWLLGHARGDVTPLLRQSIFQMVAILAPLRLREMTASMLEGNAGWFSDSLVDKPVAVVRPILQELLNDEDGRYLAANLLGMRPDLDGEATLLSLLSQPGSHRVETLRALGNAGSKRAVPHLLAFCTGSEKELAEVAANSLMNMAERGLPGVADMLASAVAESTPEGMIYLLPALGKVDGTVGARAVAAAMRHSDASVRRAAVMASTPFLADVDVQQLLMTRLADEDDEVRAAAAAACGEAAVPGASEALPILLDDENPWCQATALRALSRLGAPPPAAQLITILERGGVLAAAAASVVGHHDYSDAFPQLQRLLYSLEEDAVAELLKALSVYAEDLDEDTVKWLFAHRAWNVRLALATYIALKRQAWMLMLVRQHLSHESDGLVRMAFDELVD